MRQRPGKPLPRERPHHCPLFDFFLLTFLFLIWLHWASAVAHRTFSLHHVVWDLVPLTRDGTQAPELGARSLNRWTTGRSQPVLLLLHHDSDCQILIVSPPSAGALQEPEMALSP